MENLWKGIAILGIGLGIGMVGVHSPDGAVALGFFMIFPLIVIASR